ncbi:hypothetical protein B0I35DRAFT_126137 [Stachybotrys elegans]|uniref:Cytochrome b561 domain-containing protein n=1 Tax=Stachybotrys elegans TaxID=80388 RepID=A0A8K0T1B3_9HYPO|nr:hypothetical protein B0I35DRAFT_126137 [Stachybotrys elegans]
MLFSRLAAAALAVAAGFVQNVSAAEADNPRGQSTFVSEDGRVAFAMTVPDHDEDIYFALRMSNQVSWAGVGLGSNDMPGALYLIIYHNDDGDGVTFSPRLAYSHIEPYHFDLKYEVLNGTGIRGDYTYFYARCASCRTWPAHGTSRGWIDVNDANQDAIFAVGPVGEYRSNSPSAALRYHTRLGSFKIDMSRTRGSADPPVLNEDSANSGTTPVFYRERQWYWTATMHGVFMAIACVALFPSGAMMLRIFNNPKWHAINQSVGALFVIVGFPLGVLSSFMYQRSRGFTHYHQILGFILTAFIFAQWVLGFLHHKQYLRTHAPTRYGLPHRWLGRLILFFGVMNAFFGYTFALHRRYGAILAGVLIFIFIGTIGIVLFQRYLAAKGRGPANHPLNGGYQHPQQWRGNPNASNLGAQNSPHPGQAPQYSPHDAAPPYSPGQGHQPVYEADSTPINLQPISPWRGPPSRNDDEDDHDFDRPTKPREFT